MWSGVNLYYDVVKVALVLCSFVPVWVFVILGYQVLGFEGVANLRSEYRELEFFWTFIPSLAVAFLGYVNIQYLSPVGWGSEGRIAKIVGNQWYWAYEIQGCSGPYDSYMGDLVGGVDKPLRFEYGRIYGILVTSADVIHSFSVPELHLKLDGIPGRLNELYFSPYRLGVFVGYCSELCGAGHAHMPVVLEVVRNEGLY